VSDLFERIAGGPPERAALTAPGRPDLSYGALRDAVRSLWRDLDAAGLPPGSRVAFALPNAPETAVLAVALVSRHAAAPLHPALLEEELHRGLRALRPDALVVPGSAAGPARGAAGPARGADAPARRAAVRAGVPVLGMTAPGGRPALRPEAPARARGEPGRDPEIALVLPTSGTTAAPKTVPLRRANLLASLRSIAASLALGPEDRGLCVMPLFHVHGLVAALLAPLFAGGSVDVPGGFEPLRFFRRLSEAAPTWLTAVPTMHQAILARGARHPDAVARAHLRFVRSSSAPLPPSCARRLEGLWGCPAIEAYGMTEAAHQIASNPLPPGERRHGTVGRAAGVEVAVTDEKGAPLAAGSGGEVVIRGPSVFAGYEAPPGANDAAFRPGGWFRTGDRGRLDADGTLTLTGRTKELINRGGEKVSPFEVENALSEHPAVVQAVAFALPHASLGEEVAAAVVLAEGAEVGERELLRFAADRLAPFKRPRRVLVRESLPGGPTGKLQRIGLAGRLGLA